MLIFFKKLLFERYSESH